MSMKIVSVCVGMPRSIDDNRKPIMTGIFKHQVDGPVNVAQYNLEGDGQADLSVHGGRDKAVYAYPLAHYDYWADRIGRVPLESSQFGENLTVAGVTEEQVVLGDRYQVGTAILRVTQPRLPCFKLGIRMGINDFPRQFLDSGKLGFYLRVEQEGSLRAGDSFRLLDRPAHGITAYGLWQTVFQPTAHSTPPASALEQLPDIDEGWRKRLRRLVATQR